MTLFLLLKEILMYDNGMTLRAASARCMPAHPRLMDGFPQRHSLLIRRHTGRKWVHCRNFLLRKNLRPSEAQLAEVIDFQRVTTVNPGLFG
jgi:hypothetical protein